MTWRRAILQLLSITNFATIEHIDAEVAPGFTVLTGETGAGKSIIVDALGLLLGGRADSTFVRSGAQQARVEGVFSLTPALRERINSVTEDLLDDADDDLILVREVNREGRNICRVNGRIVPLRTLSSLGDVLVDIHGQSQHLSLLRTSEHVDILDRYGALGDLRSQVAGLVRQLRSVRHEIADLQQSDRDRARRIDLLQYEVQEIVDARLRPGEDAKLARERDLLANMESLLSLAERAHQTLHGESEWGVSVLDLLGRVTEDLRQLERLDPSLADLREAMDGIASQTEDMARSLRAYREGLEFRPERQREVEERLDLLARLKRKYGDTIDEVLAFAERAAEELGALTGSEERVEDLRGEEARLLEQIGEAAARLSQARQEAAQRLSTAVERELAELAMERTRFVVDIQQWESEDGIPISVKSASARHLAFDATGIDRVEFLIAPNPGEPPLPLARTASGGETSRLMLAIKVVLSEADRTPILVFDEVDAGIGGRIGGVVGRKLWQLSRDHQVLCVTHLPQLAAFAEAHLYVAKSASGSRTVTSIACLEGTERVRELGQMLGGTGEVSLRNAEELLERARALKA